MSARDERRDEGPAFGLMTTAIGDADIAGL
jgi:hypothetical protein